MARFRYDRSSKWLLEHHGDSLVRLAGWTDIAAWRAVTPEVVQPRQLPDGLLEVRRTGHDEPDLFVIEVATYPDNRVPRQLLRDMALVYLDRGRLPDALVLVLHPKGNVRVADHVELHGPGDSTRLRGSWRVIELWTLPADDLLALGDIGVVPWVPLAHSDEPMAVVLNRCRAAIERDARPDERDNLIAVTSVLASLRYDEREVVSILGGGRAMSEFPMIQRMNATISRRLIQKALAIKCGTVPPDVRDALANVTDANHLDALADIAFREADLDAFRAALVSPPPPDENDDDDF